MDDNRVHEFEQELWVGGPEVYEAKVARDCLMALPAEPFVFGGDQAIAAVKATPRWDEVEFSDSQISRPAEGLIVFAYRAKARRGGETAYHALCSSTYRRLSHEEWVVIQHQQTPLGVMVANPDL